MWQYAFVAVLALPVTIGGLYGSMLVLLTTQFAQSHVIYLNAFQMTGNKDLNAPEMFGFLRGQVTPFKITSKDDTQLHSWHILPIGLYREHEDELCQEPEGLASDITSRLGFKLLRDDPESRLVIHFHGAGGNIGSGYRVPNYKALSAAQPDKVHVLTFDYRGFGLSNNKPSEQGLIADALAVVTWATDVAQIPPDRILIFSQSLGTAVNMAVAERLAGQTPPTTFAGHILVAPFIDVVTLCATYKVAGVVPLLSPVAKFPIVFDWLKSYIIDKWTTSRRIEDYVRRQEANSSKYRITIIHAEDDYDIPWQHSPVLFQRAINASRSDGVEAAVIDRYRLDSQKNLGSAGLVTTWRTPNGVITERILKYGLHDVIMGNPVITLAAMRMFDAEDEK